MSVNCGWGFSAVGFQPRQCNISVGQPQHEVRRFRYVSNFSTKSSMRADSGFYTHAIVAACRKMKVCFSITVRQHARLRNIIEAIPETDWTPIPYWMDGAADVAETTYVPF